MPKVPQINKTKYMPDHGEDPGKKIVCFRGDRPIRADEAALLDNYISQVQRSHQRKNRGQKGV